MESIYKRAHLSVRTVLTNIYSTQYTSIQCHVKHINGHKQVNKLWVVFLSHLTSVMSQVTASWLATDFLISRLIEKKLNSYPEFLAKFPELLNLWPLLNRGGWWRREETKVNEDVNISKPKTWCKLSKTNKHTYTGNETRHTIIFGRLMLVSKLRDLVPAFSQYQLKVFCTHLYYSCSPLCCWGSQLNVLLQLLQGSHSL